MAVYKDKNKTKDGRQWYFKVYKKDFNGISKEYKSKRFYTKKEAQDEEALFIINKNNPNRKKFCLVADSYFKDLFTKRKESTVYTYLMDYNNHILPFFKDLYINDITNVLIKNWKGNLISSNYSCNYMNKIYNILNAIFNYAMRNFGLIYNPVNIMGRFETKKDKIVKSDEKIRYITYDQFIQFTSVINDTFWLTFFNFLYFTGMRKGEVLALTWNDIDMDNLTIKVNKTLYSKIKGKHTITSTKNNLNREIKINNTLYCQLLKYKEMVKKYTDFSDSWFVFGGSRFMSTTRIDRYKNYYFSIAKLEPITIHEFRHSHVSLLINEYIKTSKEKNMKIDMGKFFLMLSNRMGHSVQVMQATYMHLFPTVQDEIIDLLNNL